MKDKIYNELKDKKILILGFGREGKSTYQFIRQMDPNKLIAISNIDPIAEDIIKNDANLIIKTGKDYLSICEDYDVIIKGPGVIIKDYVSSSVKEKITCQTDLFLKYLPNKTIGITGTKGKSTTSSLIYHILKHLNQKVLLMGNIGIPCFDMIDKIEEDTICVIELGVHQLEFMKHSPNISVILNIYEEHLDHYLSFDHYVNAKKNIYRYQKNQDIVLLGDCSYFNNKESINNLILGVKDKDNCFYIEDDNLIIKVNNSDTIIPKHIIETKLNGDHNLYNILVCLTIIKIMNLDIGQAVKAIKTFIGLPHRMQYIGTYHNIKFYDDAIATSIPSVINAVISLKEVDTIIIGGLDRGIDYQPLAAFLKESPVRNIILLPDTNTRIKDLLKDTNQNILIVKDLVEAVDKAFIYTSENKICLLSPAAASYNAYKNFEEKGNHFQDLVKAK